MRRRYRARIRQVDVDFLCLSVFGQRALPDDMAERIAERRDQYRGLAVAFERWPDDRIAGRGLEIPAPELEAVAV